ncbi:hypothetical protein BDV35DRAFT_357963 [Aspergillus flavus]|uniref:Secreted protein n=1 Tax=Aspergillus flavus TaxID=5059 RepID=A0A5N6GRU9_ASPFL|nr:hypothetical protein BDV35DRAFT_357963 [Aspergillus flavus]
MSALLLCYFAWVEYSARGRLSFGVPVGRYSSCRVTGTCTTIQNRQVAMQFMAGGRRASIAWWSRGVLIRARGIG